MISKISTTLLAIYLWYVHKTSVLKLKNLDLYTIKSVSVYSIVLEFTPTKTRRWVLILSSFHSVKQKGCRGNYQYLLGNDKRSLPLLDSSVFPVIGGQFSFLKNYSILNIIMMQDLLRGYVPPLWANFTPFRMGSCQKWEKYRGMFYSTKSSSLEYFLNKIVIQPLNNPSEEGAVWGKCCSLSQRFSFFRNYFKCMKC